MAAENIRLTEDEATSLRKALERIAQEGLCLEGANNAQILPESPLASSNPSLSQQEGVTIHPKTPNLTESAIVPELGSDG